MALILAVGMLLVLSISVIATLEFSAATGRHASLDRADQRAFALAEAGLNDEISKVVGDPGAYTGTAVARTYPGGTVTSSGTLSGDILTLTATSSVSNPTGGSSVSRTVSQQFEVGGSDLVADNPEWKYLYSDSPTGCLLVTSSVVIKQPLYVKNDLCLDSSAQITKDAGSLRVGGKITVNSSATIGASGVGNALPELHVGGAGCARGIIWSISITGYTWPCTTSHQVYATTQTQDPGTVTKPELDLQGTYDEVKPGLGTGGCVSYTGSPPVFDTNTTMGDRASNVDLMPGSSYSCTFTGGGTITWNRTPNPDVLTISGTIFVDGNIVFGGSSTARYSGRGSIYASRKVTFNSSVKLCGAWDSGTSSCNWTTWNPETNLIVFVAGHDTGILPADAYGFTVTSSAQVQGAAYAVRDFQQDSSSTWQGPVVARQLNFNSSSTNAGAWTPFTTLPPGTPRTTAPLWPVPGSWRG